MKSILIFLIRGYQRLISPWLPPRCRFEPSCSAYAVEAIEKKGALRGVLKAAWRLLRCNPFCRGGYDPVDPPRKAGSPNSEARDPKECQGPNTQ